MNRTFLILATLLLSACGTADNKVKTDSTAQSIDVGVMPDQLISPGKGIGQLKIDWPVDSAIVRLGRPDSSDAAMGSALMVWYSKDASKYRTAVFASMNMGNEAFHRIKRIMVSSPWFKTEEGIATDTKLTEIEKKYQLKKVEDVSAQQKGLLVYSDIDKGISFDIDSVSLKCKAIIVHSAHESAGGYINMH